LHYGDGSGTLLKSNAVKVKMFVQLPNRASPQMMRVYVWITDAESCPFNCFLHELNRTDRKTATFMVTHIISIMETGELSLETSSAIEEPLRLIHAGRVWLAYFLQEKGCFICDQGVDDCPEDRQQLAEDRMLEYFRTQLIYER
jgi:hypothetical protein